MTTVRSIRQPVASLSGGQRQSVAIAKAVLWDAKLVIMDEPTAALGVAQTRMVLDLTRRLADQGHAALIVSHNMNDVFEVADRIIVLYLGRVVAQRPASELDRQIAVDLMTTGTVGAARQERRRRLMAKVDETVGRPSRTLQTEQAARQAELAVPAEIVADSVGDYFSTSLARIKAGESGVLPVVAGLILISILFESLDSNFLTAGNLVNLLVQAAVFSLLAMGEVFVLLLGEIDLSVGFVAGLGGVIMADLASPAHGWPWWSRDHRRAARLRRDRDSPGHDHHEDRPALVRRHARRPPLLAGRAPEDPRQRRDDPDPGRHDQQHRERQHQPARGLDRDARARRGVRLDALAARLEAASCRARRSAADGDPAEDRRRAGRAASRSSCSATHDRGIFAPIQGVPWVVLLVVGVLVVWTILLGRTKLGRYMYAIGGNAEAARRAGVSLATIRTIAFMLCRLTAGIAGIVYASRLRSISTSIDGGTLVLYAVAAAVIGGTSLFGGRGKAIHGVLGGIVIAGDRQRHGPDGLHGRVEVHGHGARPAGRGHDRRALTPRPRRA